MKKPKSKTKMPADLRAPFPQKIEDWTKEDHALEILLRGLRVSPRSSANPLPLPPMLYVPAMKMFFDWLAVEISEKQNQDAVERLYYLTHLAVENLSVASYAKPELFRPIAKLQLHWPSLTGWDADSAMEFDWDDNGSPTADGTYDFILTASQTTPPLNYSANMATTASANVASPTEWLAASSDGSSIVPLALYPPGMAEALGLTVFEDSLSDCMPERPAISRKTSLAVSSVSSIVADSGSLGSPAPMYSGTTQTTQRPHRPQPKPIKGSPGRLGVAWQGDHPDPGTTGIGGFHVPANLSGSIQLYTNYLLPYGPIQNAGKIANGFEKTMVKYKWKTAFNYSNDQVSASLLRKPSKGGSNLFNYCNIGV
jgi:hypothetical protein